MSQPAIDASKAAIEQQLKNWGFDAANPDHSAVSQQLSNTSQTVVEGTIGLHQAGLIDRPTLVKELDDLVLKQHNAVDVGTIDAGVVHALAEAYVALHRNKEEDTPEFRQRFQEAMRGSSANSPEERTNMLITALKSIGARAALNVIQRSGPAQGQGQGPTP